MPKLKLLNYTSTVPAEKSILDIERLLSRAGASKIAKDYSGDGKVEAFFFSINTGSGNVLFRMPCEVSNVQAVLMESYIKPHRDTAKRVKEQAERVAWRILLDWTEAQIAMIQLHRIKPEQVFMPYAYDMRTGQTLFQKLEERHFQLGDGT